jgi:uncharacterized repeat protein (TIGR01451 family)
VQITYTVAYGNNGIDTAYGATITDVLPANMTFISATGGGSNTNGTVSWNLGSLDTGATGSVSFTVQINNTLPSGVIAIANTATIATISTETTTSNNSSSTSTAVTAQPDLAITKTDGVTSVLAGDALAYTISYQNKGNQAAAGVTIVDTLLNGITYVSSSPSGTYDADTRTVTWNIGALTDFNTPHVITVQATVDSSALPFSVVGNRVTITDDGSNGTDLNPGDNTATDSDVVVAPNIVLEKQANGPVYVGSQLTYTINWSNTGTATAQSVAIQDSLPANTTLVPGSITGGGTANAGVVTWNLGDKDPGTTGSVSFSVIVNVGSGGATQTSPTFTTKNGSGSVTVTSSTTTPPTGSRPFCDLNQCAAFKGIYQGTNGTTPAGYNENPRLTTFNDTGWTAPGLTDGDEAGGVINYWTSAANLSAEWVTMHVAEETVGNYSFYRQAFCLPLNATGMNATLQLAGDDVSGIYLNGAYLGQKIGAGAAASFDGTGGVQSGINILAVQLLNNRHGGHAAFNGGDHSGLLFNLGTAYTGLRPFVSAPNTMIAGQEVTFTADELALGGRRPYQYKIDFGDGSPLVPYQSGASFTHTYNTAGTYSATLVAQAAYGCTGTDQVVINVLPSTSSLLANSATVAYQDTNSRSYNGTSGAGVEVLSAVDLSIVNTVISSGMAPGPGVTYQLVVTNHGPNNVNGASVVDTLPAAVTRISWTCSASSGGVCAHASGSGSALSEFVNLPSGATATYTIQCTLESSPAGTLSNIATVSPPNGITDLVPENNTSIADLPIILADLALTKIVSPSSPTMAAFGSDVTFRVTVANNGPSAATGVAIKDQLPNGYTFKSATPSQGSYLNTSGIWTVGTVNASSSKTLDIVATVKTYGQYANTASVQSSSAFDPDVSNNAATVTPALPQMLECDINRDQKINIDDINLIFAARGLRVTTGDPRDLDGDGLITVNDARGCVLRCDNPVCVK